MEVAERLELWRPRVLREMGRRRLWNDAPEAEREDQFQDVALVLFTRRFFAEEHLLRALWTGLGFRARDFWKSARRRETSVGEFFDDVIADEPAATVEERAAIAADARLVEDCLTELDERERAVYRLVRGDELSRRLTAKALGLTEADVLRALYSAQQKIDSVVLLLASGRLCARRAEPVRALARREARAAAVEQARAHLSHCPDCLASFRAQRAAVNRGIAAVLPLPAAVSAAHAATVVDRVVDPLRHASAAVRHHAMSLVGRAPNTTSGAEAVVASGGAGGVAVGAKLAIGLCVSAVAGGAALCGQTLGLLPVDPPTPVAHVRPPRHHHTAAAKVADAVPTPSAEPTPTPPPTPASSSTPVTQHTTTAASAHTTARSSSSASSSPEFFDDSSTSATPTASSSSSAPSASASSSGASSSRATNSSSTTSPSRSSSGSSSGEFFGG